MKGFVLVLLLIGVAWACPAGPRGLAGTAGTAGATGGTGPRGLDIGLKYTYSNATDNSIVPGEFQFDAGQLNLAANMYIETIDADGHDVANLLTFYTGSSSVPAGTVEVVVSPVSWVAYSFTLGPTLRGQTAIQLVLTYLSGPLASLHDQTNVTVFFTRTGDVGVTGTTGPAGPDVPTADATTDLGAPTKRFRTEYIQTINATAGGSSLIIQATGVTLPQGKTVLSHYEELSFLCHWDGLWTITGEERTCRFVRVGKSVTMYIPGWITTRTFIGIPTDDALLLNHDNSTVQLTTQYPQFMPVVTSGNSFWTPVLTFEGGVESTSKINIDNNGVLFLGAYQPNSTYTAGGLFKAQDIYLTWITLAS